MRSFLATAAAALVAATPASAAGPHEQLEHLASRQAHGWVDVHKSYPELEATIASGRRVYVPCGVVAILGQRLMNRAGIPSRLVSAFRASPQPFLDVPAGVRESHALLEVWLNGRWQVYDLDGNVKPIDRQGRGMTLRRFARRTVPAFQVLAVDRAHDLRESPNPRYEQWLFNHPDDWYRRVLQITAVMPVGADHYVYTGNQPLPFGGYRWVSNSTYRAAVKRPAPPAPEG